MEKKYMIATFSVLVLAMFVVGLNIGNVGDSEVGDSLDYGSNVCAFAKLSGEWVDLGCQENTVVENGLDAVKLALGTGSVEKVSKLALGNETAPALADTALAGLWSTNGLTMAEAAYNTNGVGNWSQAYTWTATGDNLVVNTTALYLTDGTTLFAGTSFTTTTLQTDDQLKVNYTTWCT